MPDPIAPAAAPESAAPAPAAPSVSPSDAGRTLAQRRAEIRQSLRETPSSAPSSTPSAAPIPSTSGSAAPAASPSGSPTSSSSTTPTPEKPAESPADDDLARLIAEDRRLKTAARDLDARESRVKQYEELYPVIEKARGHLEKGDRVSAAREVFGDAGLDDLFYDLLKVQKQKSDRPEGEADMDTWFERKMRERDQAAQQTREQKEAEERRKAEQGEVQRLAEVDKTVQQPGFSEAVKLIPTLKGAPTSTIESYGKYVAAVTRVFTANPAAFAAIERLGVWPIDVVRKSEEIRAQKREPPSYTEVLKALDDDLRARAAGLAGGQPVAEAPKPSPTLSSDLRQGDGRPEPASQGPLTLDQKREQRRLRLRGGQAA